MAEAIKVLDKRQVVTWRPELKRVTVHLTPEEAVAVTRVLDCVGGHPSYTARRYVDDVKTALRTAGVPTFTELAGIDLQRQRESFYFEANSDKRVVEIVIVWRAKEAGQNG